MVPTTYTGLFKFKLLIQVSVTPATYGLQTLYYGKFPLSQKVVLDSTALRSPKHTMRHSTAILKVAYSKDVEFFSGSIRKSDFIHLQTLFNIWVWNKIPGMSNIKTRNFSIRLSYLVSTDGSGLLHLLNKLF